MVINVRLGLQLGISALENLIAWTQGLYMKFAGKKNKAILYKVSSTNFCIIAKKENKMFQYPDQRYFLGQSLQLYCHFEKQKKKNKKKKQKKKKQQQQKQQQQKNKKKTTNTHLQTVPLLCMKILDKNNKKYQNSLSSLLIMLFFCLHSLIFIIHRV